MKRKSRKKDYEIKFYEGLLKKRPDFAQALSSLGDAYTRQGFYKEGLEVDQRLVRLKPDDPIAHYNLACSLALVGDIARAKQEVARAVEFGYDDFAYILEDKDLEGLRNDPGFSEFFYAIKQHGK